MTALRCVLLVVAAAIAAPAAVLPPVPPGPIARKRDLLFADHFEGATPDARWHKVVPTFFVTNGVLKGLQTRDRTIPAADGQPAVTAHAAVHGLNVPTRDSVVEARIRLDGAGWVSVEFDDRAYKGAHYGHICLARVQTNGVTLMDQREGTMRNDIYAMAKDPARKAERAELLKGRQVTYPMRVEPGRWHDLVVETVGDTMRVTLDGRPAAYLKSPGLAHATKSKLEFGVGGKEGLLDDLKVWSAEPAR